MSLRTHPQAGQALTEFLVLAVALLPLFLLMPVLARYQDISHALQMASRYAAFYATVQGDDLGSWKPESQLADELRRRFFSGSNEAIRSVPSAGDESDAASAHPFWRDPRGNPLIARTSRDVVLEFGPNHGSRYLDAFTSSRDGDAFLLRQQLALPARGIFSATVSARLADLPAGLAFYRPFDTIGLRIERSTSVLPLAWTAKDPQTLESRITGNPAIFPAASLSAIGEGIDAAVSIIDAPGAIPGPRLGKLDFWRDVVPQDRLKSGR